VNSISIDPARLLGFRLTVAEALANGQSRSTAVLGLKQGGKDGLKQGAKFGNKAGDKPA